MASRPSPPAVAPPPAWSTSDLTPDVARAVDALVKVRASRAFPGDELDVSSVVHAAFVLVSEQIPSVRQARAAFFFAAARVVRQRVDRHDQLGPERAPNGDAFRWRLRVTRTAPWGALCDALRADHPRRAQIVELHVFAGLELTECAHLVGMTQQGVEAEWRMADDAVGAFTPLVRATRHAPHAFGQATEAALRRRQRSLPPKDL